MPITGARAPLSRSERLTLDDLQALAERERAHPDGDDTSGARVRWRRVGKRGSGEQEAPGWRAVIHGASHEIPYLWQSLPLVDEHRSLTLQQARWVSFGDSQLSGVVQTVNRLGSLQRRAGLPHPLGAFDGDGCQVAEELVKLVVHDAALIWARTAHSALGYQDVMLKESFATP